MDNVFVNYCGITCFVVEYDFNDELYTIEDKEGNRIKVHEHKLKYLSDK